MTHAFILRDETVLCRQTPNGWWPVQVQLPDSVNDTALNTHDIHDIHNIQPAYQVGRVTLLESLAPTHWLPNNDIKSSTRSIDSADNDSLADFETDTANTFTSQAAIAITYDYAITHHIDLPRILESHHVENSSPDTDTCAFIAYRLLITQLPFALSDQ